jgi:hypothetical protein
MRTLLCTHCYAPLAGTALDAGDATFCSARCRDLDALREAMPSRVRVLVAIVHNGPMVERRVTESLIALGWGERIPRVKAALGIEAIDMAWFTKMPRVDALRNCALEQARRDGFTHVLFLDADMIFPDDLFARILKHHAVDGIVSGFYTQRHFPFAPVAFRDGVLHESGRYVVYRHDNDHADVDAQGLRAEELVGMGCCLIPLRLLDALGARPWFYYKDDAAGWPLISEDVPFCEAVRAAGFGVYLDPSIQCGHLFSEFATEQHWTRYQQVHAHTQQRLAEQMTVTVTPQVEAVP